MQKYCKTKLFFILILRIYYLKNWLTPEFEVFCNTNFAYIFVNKISNYKYALEDFRKFTTQNVHLNWKWESEL